MRRASSDKRRISGYSQHMQHYLIFGTHPRLSLAEWQIVGENSSAPIICGNGVLVQAEQWDGAVFMNRLGGTTKLGDILGSMSTKEFSGERVAQLLEEAGRLPDHALDFGWSVFGGGKGARFTAGKQAIAFKKALKARGVASRWVTSKDGDELSPAAVAKLKLTTEGLDICILLQGEVAHIGLSTDVQDADAWSLRDYGRPVRDDKNGMLPPKLARMMVNMAWSVERGASGGTMLDPFCGGGTVLMEAALATTAAHLIGSDLEAKQIADANQNIKWLIDERVLREDDAERFRIFKADVRKLATHIPAGTVDQIVTEGYMGPALHGNERQAELDKNVEQISSLWRESLHVFRTLLAEDGRVVCIWPAFKTAHGLARVDLSEEIQKLGFQLVEPLAELEGKASPLLYSRPGQYVQRRIVILSRRPS